MLFDAKIFSRTMGIMLLKLPFVSVSLVALVLASCASSKASTPTSKASTPTTVTPTSNAQATESTVHEHAADSGSTSGTSSSAEGLELVLSTLGSDASLAGLEFSIVGVDEKVVDILADYETVHEKQMHVTLVRHDLSEYRHVHPVLSQGVWSVEPLTLPEGFYRLVADFTLKDKKHVALGVDITVGASPSMSMARLSQEVRTSSSFNYSVSVSGSPQHDSSQVLSFVVSKDGVPVLQVDPYLGANGHLVAYDSPSLKYTHMHPNPGIKDGTVTFTAPASEHGFSKYFLEVKLDGEVRLFTFVLEGM